MTILLVENVPSHVLLTVAQVAALQQCIPGLIVQPVLDGQPGRYKVTPGSVVGRVNVAGMSVEIRSKVPIGSMLFMLAYSIDPRHWQDLGAVFAEETGPLDGIAAAFGRELSRTLPRGVLRGYMPRHESLPLVRGRVRVPEQLRRWYGRMPPVECGYDEFTEDVLENRLIKAALRALRAVRIRSDRARSELARAEMHLESVSDAILDRRALPDITYTRLNDRFRRAVEIAKLIVRSTTIEGARGGVSASGILIDMSGVFENFVITALNEARNMRPWSLPRTKQHGTLDLSRRFRLIPDLTFRCHGQLAAVGDVKYKRTPPTGANHPDVYQVLAYAVGFDTTSAVLVYPMGEADVDAGTHPIRHVGKTLHVLKVDVSKGPARILESVEALAKQIRARVAAPDRPYQLPPT